MNWNSLLYAAVPGLAGLVCVCIAMYAWRRRDVPGGAAFAWCMLAAAVIALAAAGSLATPDLDAKIAWAKLTYAGTVTAGPLWLVFALAYGGYRQWLTPRRIAGLMTVPLAVFLLALTNEWHGLVWPHVALSRDTLIPLAVFTPGPVVWLNRIYSYAALLSGTILLLQTLERTASLFRRQVVALLAGIALPWIANALYAANVLPLPGLDLTSAAIAFTGILIFWALFRLQVLNIVPIARDILVEQAQDAMLVLDAQTRLVDVNPAAAQLLGCVPKHMIGRRVADALAPWPDLRARAQDDSDAEAEIALEAQGARRSLEVRSTPLYDGRRRPIGKLITLHDVTALRRYARELEASNAELDAFAHSVAHDIRGPLTVVSTYSNLLVAHRARFTPAETGARLERIAQSAKKLNSIVSNLLLLASVRKVNHLQLGPLDMAAVVAEARGRLSDEVANSRATLTDPGQWPCARGYAPWVEEIWVNYLSNALKYGGDPPQLELGWDACAGGFRFWVRDNGPGLTLDEQAQLFTEFTRLEQARVEGYGLGLSIVRRIVERLGGQAGVESTTGAGSLFWFTLPTA